MAVAPLFFGLLLLVWLALGTAGWTLAALRTRRPTFLALGVALGTAVIGGMLPALAGWRTLPGLLCGLLLALVGSAAVAWQTEMRIPQHKYDGPEQAPAGSGEQDA